MPTEVVISILLFVLLVAAGMLGLRIQPRLPERHRSRETIDSVRLVITMLVTFAALVLGLLVSAANADFANATTGLRAYGVSLIEFDERMRQYGPETTPLRAEMRKFAASVLVDGWPYETRPTGSYLSSDAAYVPGSDESPGLTTMLMDIDKQVQSLDPKTPFQGRIAAIAQTLIQTIEQQRWAAIEIDHPIIAWPFMTLLMMWLCIVFLVLGLSSPSNGLFSVVLLLSAISVTSALYLILDLDTRLTGFIHLSSQPIRDALLHMDQVGR